MLNDFTVTKNGNITFFDAKSILANVDSVRRKCYCKVLEVDFEIQLQHFVNFYSVLLFRSVIYYDSFFKIENL